MYIPFSKNSSSCAVSSLRMSLSGTLCFNKAKIYSARAPGSASQLEVIQEGGQNSDINKGMCAHIGSNVRTNQGLSWGAVVVSNSISGKMITAEKPEV